MSIGVRTRCVSWSAVQEEHNRIVAIVPFDRDPLIDSPDPNKHFFCNPPIFCNPSVCGGSGRLPGDIQRKDKIGKIDSRKTHCR
jgi:hypothetical protein